MKEICEPHEASTESAPLTQDHLVSKAKEHMVEYEDRVRRRSNLLIFRLSDSESAKREDRKEKDTDNVHKILEETEILNRPFDQRQLLQVVHANLEISDKH